MKPRIFKGQIAVKLGRIDKDKDNLLKVKLAKEGKTFGQFLREAVDKFLSY